MRNRIITISRALGLANEDYLWEIQSYPCRPEIPG